MEHTVGKEFWIGTVNGVLMSIPLWIAIIELVRFVF